MQKFTRSLAREVVIGGERLALTLDAEGVAIRPVGSRRPPVQVSWATVLCAATGAPADEAALADALAALRGAAPRPVVARDATASPVCTTLEEWLARLDHWMRRHRPRYLDGLRPGADNRQLAALENVLYQPLPPELRAWLAWHNGQDPQLIGAFHEAFTLLSAEQIGREWHVRQREADPSWNTAWLPLLDDYQGDLIVLDTTRPGCPLRELWRGRDEHPIVAPSLLAWISTFVTDVEAGRYQEDPERGEFRRS